MGIVRGWVWYLQGFDTQINDFNVYKFCKKQGFFFKMEKIRNLKMLGNIGIFFNEFGQL